MKFSEVQLPSNSKFGVFFTLIFICTSVYFSWKGFVQLSLVLILLAIMFALITIIKAELLLPLNKLWMGLGLILGAIISPIVLGVFFFLLFTPIGLLLRTFGRDELRIKLSTRKSFWKLKNNNDSNIESFKNQF